MPAYKTPVQKSLAFHTLASCSWGTYHDDCTPCLSHLRTFSPHITVIIDEELLSSFFSFTFKPKILQSFISSQLTTWFRHDSQKTSMPPPHSWHWDRNTTSQFKSAWCWLTIIIIIIRGTWFGVVLLLICNDLQILHFPLVHCVKIDP